MDFDGAIDYTFISIAHSAGWTPPPPSRTVPDSHPSTDRHWSVGASIVVPLQRRSCDGGGPGVKHRIVVPSIIARHPHDATASLVGGRNARESASAALTADPSTLQVQGLTAQGHALGVGRRVKSAGREDHTRIELPACVHKDPPTPIPYGVFARVGFMVRAGAGTGW